MPQPSLRTPLGVLAVGLVLALFLLFRPHGDQVALSQSYPATAVPPTTSAYTGPVTASTAEPTVQGSPTLTVTVGLQPTAAPTTAPTAAPETRTRPPSPTVALPTATLEPTATQTQTTTLTCMPGEVIEIRGSGPPRIPVLLYFEKRVVGGASVSSTGEFILPLRVGNERPGSYAVIVRVRGSSQELLRKTCNVPFSSPTPTRRPRA